MDFGATYVLVDGSFHSPFVWVALLGTTLALAIGTLGLVWVLTRTRLAPLPRLALGACAAVLAVSCSPGLFERIAEALASIGSAEPLQLCLMPTNLFLRDYSPGILAVIAAAVHWRAGAP